MNRFWTLLLNRRVLALLGLAALAAFVLLGASALQLALMQAAVVLALVALVALLVWGLRRWQAARAARRLEQAIEDDAEQATLRIRAEDRAPAQAVRDRLLAAVKTIRSSRLGQLTGRAALYELPWYIVIGNPAAGKSSAVVASGLDFPLAADGSGADSPVVQGIGGTRNCDWFLTSKGILIDTAGRYAVHEEDHAEWLGFLGLLRRHRPMAPINGIVIAVSVAELAQGGPQAATPLAKRLRQRVQELTERLEVFAPLYLVFTKADLIAGFAEFFEDLDASERDRVWGATLPYAAPDDSARAVAGGPRSSAPALFDEHFDTLREGLQAIALGRMSLHRGQALPPALLSFPLEFDAIRPALRSFVATLFEDNPYQFQPVFRGFYFTSAVQEGPASSRASAEVARQFALGPAPGRPGPQASGHHGYFLKGLFQRVIFADRQLVRQYASRRRQRRRGAVFAAAVVSLALLLAGWSGSYLANRQLMDDVRADLDKARQLQVDRIDLASRLEALEVLQYRLEQLAAWRTDRPAGLGLGLYQGEAIERRLRAEYFDGLRQVMLQPVAQAIEGYLGEVNAHAAQLQPLTRAPASGAAALAEAPQPPVAPDVLAASTALDARVPERTIAGVRPGSRYAQASPADVEDAYNALKTYLMLAERPRRDAGHLKDQIARFWRGWLDSQRGNLPPEQLKRRAERLLSFALGSLQDPDFPSLDNKLSLVDQTRDHLRRVMRGLPARERVLAEVKARASTRFPQVTVAGIVGEAGRASLAGSQVVSGAFTREAWHGYIEQAFRDAAAGELQSTDWVLQSALRDDLTLDGSPDQIRRTLTELYKAEYVREWQRFMQGIALAEFGSFDAAVQHMNRLGDPADSPIRRLLLTLHEQTSWDNPAALNAGLARMQHGVAEWFRQTVLRQAPAPVAVKLELGGPAAEMPMGPIGREFAALQRLVAARDGQPALVDDYLKALGAVRSRFNQIRTLGDPGPAARKLMAATLDGSGSELGDAVRLVEERMLSGLGDSARATLRPLLLRPLMQGYAVLVPPAEAELNRAWAAQVHEPFQRTLAGKYPFDPGSRVEAVPQEIAKIFGPSGAVAAFAGDALGPLVTRRGDSIGPRSWLDMGVRLRPEFSGRFAQWVAPLDGAAGAAAASTAVAQTSFQILPQGAPGLGEYTIEIDGQLLRYRNGAAVWTPMVWPNPGGTPGVRITALTLEGRHIELLNVPGHFGLQRLFEAAERRKLADGSTQLGWSQGPHAVAVQLRVISQPGTTGGGAASGPATLRGLRLPTLVAGIGEPLATAAAVTAVAAGTPR